MAHRSQAKPCNANAPPAILDDFTRISSLLYSIVYVKNCTYLPSLSSINKMKNSESVIGVDPVLRIQDKNVAVFLLFINIRPVLLAHYLKNSLKPCIILLFQKSRSINLNINI